MEKIFKGLLFIAGGLAVIIIILLFIIWLKSPGTTQPVTDAHGKKIRESVARIEKVNLGGLDQYIIIRGMDSTRPVILFLHGGPGAPEVALMNELNPGLEENYVMVYWEERGAGKSFSGKIDPESMTLDQMVQDTRQLSKMLIDRFDKDKIYLMGHSWGSFLGIQTVYRHPDLFHVFFGIGQVCHQYRGERIAFEWVKEQAAQQNDKKALRALSGVSFPDSLADARTWFNYLRIQRKYASNFRGGITRETTGRWPAVKMILNAGEYTLGDKLNYLRGGVFSLRHLWTEVMYRNLFDEIDSVQIPVYIFQGKYDYQTPYILAKEFHDQLKAPRKEFLSFENSAHSPQVEEVDKFNNIVKSKILEP